MRYIVINIIIFRAISYNLTLQIKINDLLLWANINYTVLLKVFFLHQKLNDLQLQFTQTSYE